MKRDGGPIFWDGSPFGTEDLLARLAQGCGGGRGERPAGRDAQLRALKKGAPVRMQRPADTADSEPCKVCRRSGRVPTGEDQPVLPVPGPGEDRGGEGAGRGGRGG